MKKSFIKVALFGALTLATSCFIGCSDYDDDIKNLQGQVDELKSLSIADLESQLKSLKEADANLTATSAALEGAIKEIKANLESLTAASEVLKTAVDGKVDQSVYDAAIKALNEQSADLAEKLAALSKQQAEIDAKADKSEVEKLQTELNNSLTSLRADLEGRIAGIETTLNGMATKAELEAAQKALQDRIAALESGNESLKAATEANKTAIDELSKTVSPLKTSIEEITGRLGKAEGTIAELQKSVNTVDSRISTAITNLKLTLEGKIDAIETAYKAADDELSRRIKVLEDSKFKDSKEYTTLTNNVASLKEEIYGKDGKGGLKQQYADLKSQVDNLFKEGTAENGKLTTAIATQISAALAESGVVKNAIDTAISAVTGRITVLESQVKDLMKQIQSIVFVPQYTDASGVFAPAYYINGVGGEMNLQFRISPADKAQELAEIASKRAASNAPIFSFIVENALETRATTTEPLKINTITSIEDGVITVTATPTNGSFPNDKYLPTALKVSTTLEKAATDTITDITTEYFKVKGQVIAANNASVTPAYDHAKSTGEYLEIDYADMGNHLVNIANDDNKIKRPNFQEFINYNKNIGNIKMEKAQIGFDQNLAIYAVYTGTTNILINKNGKAVKTGEQSALDKYLSDNHFALVENTGVKLTTHDPKDADNNLGINLILKDETFGFDKDEKTPLATFEVRYQIAKVSANRMYDYKAIQDAAVWKGSSDNAAKNYTASFSLSNMTTLYDEDKNADSKNVLAEMKASDENGTTEYYVTIGKSSRTKITADDNYKMQIDLTKDKDNVKIQMPANYAWTSYIFETVYVTSYGKITAKANLNLSYPGHDTFLTAVPARWNKPNETYFVQYDKPADNVENFEIVNVLKGDDANAYVYNKDATYTYELLEEGNYKDKDNNVQTIGVTSDGTITVKSEIKYKNTSVTPNIELAGKDAIDHVRIKVTVKVAGNYVMEETFGISLAYPMPTIIDVPEKEVIYSASAIKNKTPLDIAKGVNMTDNHGWNMKMIEDGIITDYANKTWGMKGTEVTEGNKTTYVTYTFEEATQGLTKDDFTITKDGKLSFKQINLAQDAKVTIKVSTTYNYGASEGTFTIVLKNTNNPEIEK